MMGEKKVLFLYCNFCFYYAFQIRSGILQILYVKYQMNSQVSLYHWIREKEPVRFEMLDTLT